MDVEVRVHPRFSSRVQRASLLRFARRALRAERAPVGTGVALYVTTDAEIRALNRRFHATNAATDVLAFPSQVDAPTRPAGGATNEYIGDVVISYERARVQARAAGWRIADELGLLAVHGLLHLLGYDDLRPGPRARMWKRQEKILGHVAGGNLSQPGATS